MILRQVASQPEVASPAASSWAWPGPDGTARSHLRTWSSVAPSARCCPCPGPKVRGWQIVNTVPRANLVPLPSTGDALMRLIAMEMAGRPALRSVPSTTRLPLRARYPVLCSNELHYLRAPLRNRTVDLLLTIHTSLGSLPGKHFPQAAGERRSGSCPGLRRLRSLRPSRLQPSSSWHESMPSVRSARPRLACHSSLASGAACRPATSTPTVKGRSDDLSYPARPGPEDHAEQAFPHRRKNLNQCPYLHLA